MSGKPAARQGDMTQYGGSIVQGSAGVRIGAPTGVACSVCPGGVTSGHPVNPLLGAKVLPGETDIALPGPLPFILSRTYSSYRTKTPAPVGSLGPGWKMPADIRLQLRDNTLILSDNGGRSLYFEHLFPGEDGYSRSESLWLVRGGVATLDEGHRLAQRIVAAPGRFGLLVDQHLAGVGLVDARQQLDQRALAGAVLAQQRQHPASMHVQRHVVDGLRAAEALADALEAEQGTHAVAPRVFSTMR